MTIENQHGDGITSDNNVIEKGIDIRDAGSGSANPNEKKNNRTKNSKKEKSQNKMPKQNHPGKGNKPKGKVVKNVPHKDQYQRISFLYQAANAMAFDPATEALGRMYTRAMKDTAKKSVLRLSPTVKRSVCKKCNRVLINGYTVKTRITNSSRMANDTSDVLELVCVCGEVKRFPVGQNPDYVVWANREERTQ